MHCTPPRNGEHTEKKQCKSSRGTSKHKINDRVVSTRILVNVLSVGSIISMDERNRTAMLKSHMETTRPVYALCKRELNVGNSNTSPEKRAG